MYEALSSASAMETSTSFQSFISSLPKAGFALRLIRLRLAATRCCAVESCNSLGNALAFFLLQGDKALG